MDLAGFDLNLLKCFDAIHRHRSVSLAADELGITQGGMSAALRRLREAFDNPLFARATGSMQATPMADSIAPRIRALLDEVRVLDRQERFSPALTRLQYRLHMNDAGLMLLLPRLMRRLQADAPGAELAIVDTRPDEVIDALDQGRVDVAVGYFLGVPGWARQQKLRDSSYVCVVRADHPRIGEHISLEQFVSGEHVMYWSHDALHHTLEATLARMRITRKVKLRIPRFSAIPALLAESDYILTVPEDVGVVASRYARVKLLRPPFAIPRFSVRQYWHERLNADPAYRWFRNVVKEETDKLGTR